MKQLKIKLPLRTMALAGGLLLATSSFAQNNIVVKGHVTDASGEPVMGATITVKGKALGVTDIDGNFSLDAAPGTELTFTFLGHRSQPLSGCGHNAASEADCRDFSRHRRYGMRGILYRLRRKAGNHVYILSGNKGHPSGRRHRFRCPGRQTSGRCI